MALGDTHRKRLRSLPWGMREIPKDWSPKQLDSTHWLQHFNLKSVSDWRLKQALREVYAQSRVEQLCTDG